MDGPIDRCMACGRVVDVSTPEKLDKYNSTGVCGICGGFVQDMKDEDFLDLLVTRQIEKKSLDEVGVIQINAWNVHLTYPKFKALFGIGEDVERQWVGKDAIRIVKVYKDVEFVAICNLPATEPSIPDPSTIKLP